MTPVEVGPVRVRAVPVVKEEAVINRAFWVVAPEVIALVSKLLVRVSAVLVSPKVVLPLTVRSEAVTMAPVVPETVKFEVSTAIPPSRLTRVGVVAPLPVTVARVEVLAMVTVSVAPPVVVISVPAAMVMVSPALMVWLLPEVPASVIAKVPPPVLVRQVTQPISPAEERVMGAVAETATVPVALGKVMVFADTVGSVMAKMV